MQAARRGVDGQGFNRESMTMGSIQCEHCAGTCCNYLALPIDKPKTIRDYDDIRWYLLHEGISVFVEDGDWFIQIQTRCKQLGEDNRCSIYESRPRICAEYSPGECDYSESDYGCDHLFTHAKQVEEFYAEKTGLKLAVDHLGKRPRPRIARNAASALVSVSTP